MATVMFIFTMGTSHVASEKKQYEASDWDELKAEFGGTEHNDKI